MIRLADQLASRSFRFRQVAVAFLVLSCVEAVARTDARGREQSLSQTLVDDKTLSVRREYNQVAAAVDTIMRQYGSQRIADVATPGTRTSLLPNDAKLVLLMWADDEAELFLNGTPVARTRLTPIRVEIPQFYLKEENLLKAHCWDTDQVESGFMAGLYVERNGDLTAVLTSGDEHWKMGESGAPAQEIFYTHTQPDIPGASVIWGERLFGEVWLNARFTAGDIGVAGRQPPQARLSTDWDRREMDFHLVISRLVRLQQRREELSRDLENRRVWVDPYLRYRGTHRSPLAYSLGRAEPLGDERKSVSISKQLVDWVERLPSDDRELVLRPPRELKGAASATPARPLDAAEGARGDRRRDYQPPPELGSQPGIESVVSVGALQRVGQRAALPWLWTATAFLALYAGAVVQRWWRLFNAETAAGRAT